MQELSLVSGVHLWWKTRDRGTGTVPFWQLGSCLYPTSLRLLLVNHLNGDPMRTNIFHLSISSPHSVSAWMEENHFWGELMFKQLADWINVLGTVITFGSKNFIAWSVLDDSPVLWWKRINMLSPSPDCFSSRQRNRLCVFCIFSISKGLTMEFPRTQMVSVKFSEEHIIRHPVLALVTC